MGQKMPDGDGLFPLMAKCGDISLDWIIESQLSLFPQLSNGNSGKRKETEVTSPGMQTVRLD